jgi:hypothetical protein
MYQLGKYDFISLYLNSMVHSVVSFVLFYKLVLRREKKKSVLVKNIQSVCEGNFVFKNI